MKLSYDLFRSKCKNGEVTVEAVKESQTQRILSGWLLTAASQVDKDWMAEHISETSCWST